MANPVNVPIAKNTWVKVTTNVTIGYIRIKQWQPDKYYQTYRVTGDPAPTGDYNESTSVEVGSRQINISSSIPIDVYFYCVDLNGAVVVAV